MADRKEGKLGALALALSLSGVGVGMAVGLLARLVGHNADAVAFLLFTAFQVAAIVLGLVAWRTQYGKAAAITAAVLAVGSWTLLV